MTTTYPITYYNYVQLYHTSRYCSKSFPHILLLKIKNLKKKPNCRCKQSVFIFLYVITQYLASVSIQFQFQSSFPTLSIKEPSAPISSPPFGVFLQRIELEFAKNDRITICLLQLYCGCTLDAVHSLKNILLASPEQI